MERTEDTDGRLVHRVQYTNFEGDRYWHVLDDERWRRVAHTGPELDHSEEQSAARSAWRCRSLEITGIYIERDGVRQYVAGEKVAPLSRRDVYILSRAADRVWWSWNYFGFNEFDPESDRFYRHVRDWLRMETDDGAPHWVHSLRAVQAEQDSEYRPTRTSARPTRTTAGPRTNPTTTMVTTA